MLCISLDFIGAAERGEPAVWAAQGFRTLSPRLAPWRGHSSLATWRETTRKKQNKAYHNVPWRQLRSKAWHQLDLILTKRDSLNSIRNSRAYRSADCDTDHWLTDYLEGETEHFKISSRKDSCESTPVRRHTQTKSRNSYQEFLDFVWVRNTDQQMQTRVLKITGTQFATPSTVTTVLTYGKRERTVQIGLSLTSQWRSQSPMPITSVTQIRKTCFVESCMLEAALSKRHAVA